MAGGGARGQTWLSCRSDERGADAKTYTAAGRAVARNPPPTPRQPFPGPIESRERRRTEREDRRDPDLLLAVERESREAAGPERPREDRRSSRRDEQKRPDREGERFGSRRVVGEDEAAGSVHEERGPERDPHESEALEGRQVPARRANQKKSRGDGRDPGCPEVETGGGTEEPGGGAEQQRREWSIGQVDVAIEPLALAHAVSGRPGVRGVAAGINPSAARPQARGRRHEKKNDLWHPAAAPARGKPRRERRPGSGFHRVRIAPAPEEAHGGVGSGVPAERRVSTGWSPRLPRAPALA